MRRTFVGKVMSLLFNMLSRLVITFLPRSKHLLISWLQSPSAVILEPPKNKVSHCFHCFPIYLPWSDGTRCHDLSFPNVSFKPTFSICSFTFIKRLFSSSSLSVIRVMSSAYLRLLIFLLAILIPACASPSPSFLMMYSAYKLNKWKKVKSLSRVQLFATPWTIAYQGPLSMGFSWQEYWSGLPFPSPGDLPKPGIAPGSPPLRADALPSEPPEKPFSYLEPVCWSMSSSNRCFLTCIQISQEAGQVIWYSHLFQNFPQFIVIHTVKGFGIVNKAEIDVFLELSCFFNDPADVGNLISGSSAFSKTVDLFVLSLEVR